MADEENEPSNEIILFGTNFSRIPCFRGTFLYGISSYIGVSLLAFLFTSKPALSSHYGFGSFLAVSVGYWIQCRSNYAQSTYASGQIQAVMQKALVLEGTEEAEKLKKT